MGKAEYWHKAGRRIPFMICAALTAVLLFSAVGYATSYQATTNVTGNAIEVDYFTAAFYSDSSCSTVVTDLFIDEVEYSVSGSTYSIEDGTVLSVEALYFKVTAVGHSGTSFSIDTSQTTCNLKNSTVTSDLAGTVLICDTEGNALSSVAPNTAYGITLVADEISTSLTSAPDTLVISFKAVVSDTNTATYSDSARSITLSSEEAAHAAAEATAAAALDGLNDWGHFTPASEGSTHSSGVYYEGGAGVTAAQGDNNTIDTNAGKVNVNLHTIVGSEFVIAVKVVNTSGNTYVDITLDSYSTVKIPADNTKLNHTFIVYMNGAGNGLVVDDLGVVTGHVQLGAFMQGKAWMEGDVVSIENDGNGARVTFDLVMQY